MIATTGTSILQLPILRALVYHGLFRHPMTIEELHHYLETPLDDHSLLREALEELVDEGRIVRDRGYYRLRSESEEVVDRRIAMEIEGERMWRAARRVAAIARHLPFVRGLFISGQLCRYIADGKSDIDFFVVTSPGRLWIVRTAYVLARRIFLFNNRRFFCTNYFVTEENLVIRERNPYTANELASIKPIHNLPLYHRMMEQNRWVAAYHPNFDPRRIELRPGTSDGSRLRALLETLTPRRLADALDVRLMRATAHYWRRRYPGRSEAFYASSVRSSPHESRGHVDDHAPVILAAYRARLEAEGIADA